MKIHRVEVPGLVHYSYVLSSQGQAAVLDPRRDVDVYLDYAHANQLRITHILETHIHADYASGARELADSTGAELWLSAHDKGEDFEYSFPHREFRDGDSLAIGELRIEAIHTPGHTPEHLSYLVTDLSRGNYPAVLFSGDFVFIGSLGRPDLLGDEAKRGLANSLFDSVTRKIASLPDGLEVLPSHGAGSLCGAGMSERPQSTLGYERHTNPFFSIPQREPFVNRILAGVPPFPDYYRRMKRLNSAGPARLDGIPGGLALSAADFHRRIENQHAVVIDLRSPEAFGGAHIPGSINIGAGPSFNFWAGWVVPYDRPLFLLSDGDAGLEDARRGLIRVGLDRIEGYLDGGLRAWLDAGYPESHLKQISVEELHAKLPHDPFVLDVRSDSEWQSGHIADARHVYAGEATKHLAELPSGRPLHLVCASGYRSSIVSSLLLREGLRDVLNVIGGMNAWSAAGLPVTSSLSACAK
ncbi:MAG TPA: MBL fold metallo-hydrolase [Terriglobales bacterium]|nr:MBL fold metallo-hydrolase [Terriglobales bacterium]